MVVFWGLGTTKWTDESYEINVFLSSIDYTMIIILYLFTFCLNEVSFRGLNGITSCNQFILPEIKTHVKTALERFCYTSLIMKTAVKNTLKYNPKQQFMIPVERDKTLICLAFYTDFSVLYGPDWKLI